MIILRRFCIVSATALFVLSVVLMSCSEKNPVTPPNPASDTTYTLTVNKTPVKGGTVSRSPDKATYGIGDTVTVTATAAEGYEFAGWTGAATSKDAVVKIVIDNNKTITANFKTATGVTPGDTTGTPPGDTTGTPPEGTYTLTTNVTPVTGGIIVCSPVKAAYTVGDTVTVMAIAADGHEFNGWSGAVTSKEAIAKIVMNGNKTITANFKTKVVTPGDSTGTPPSVVTYTLTSSVTPVDGGTVVIAPSKTVYIAGDTVTVVASAAKGYEFTGWIGATTSKDMVAKIVMNGNKTVTATFKLQEVTPPPISPERTYTLTIDVTPEDGGIVYVRPEKTEFVAGDTVAIYADASRGYEFTGWSGASTSKDDLIKIVMDGNKTINATFKLQEVYTLTTSVTPANSGTVTRLPDKATYIPGDWVKLTATAAKDYTFTGWSGTALTTTDNSKTIDIKMDSELD